MINKQFPQSVITLLILMLKAIFKIKVINIYSESEQQDFVSMVHFADKIETEA